MSASAQKRISAAMKPRWAKWKGKSAPKKAKVRPPTKAAALNNSSPFFEFSTEMSRAEQN